MSKKDIMFYTQEVTKHIKDGVNTLAKQLEGQKNDVSDKVRSLNFLIDNSSRRLSKNQEVLHVKLEEISGQRIMIPEEASNFSQ